MGIRVAKMVGFGMRGFSPPEGFSRRYMDDETTLAEFVVWCREHTDTINAFAPTDTFRHTMLRIELDAIEDDAVSSEKGLLHGDGRMGLEMVRRYVEWDDEFGIKDVIMFVPMLHHKTWHRYDNTVDWCEETALHEQQKRFVPLEREISPHVKGKPPLSVAALALFYGIPEVWPKLHEALYVYWS